jgi:hypothetical protein
MNRRLLSMSCPKLRRMEQWLLWRLAAESLAYQRNGAPPTVADRLARRDICPDQPELQESR